LPAALIAILVAVAVLAPAAHADLRPGSTRSFMTKSGALREPLPRLRATPRVVSRPGDGRLVLKVRARYRVTNWHGSKRVRRDRALLFVTVASRMLRNGPSPVGRVFSHTWVDHGLRHRHAGRSYKLVLSRKASRFLRERGVFSDQRRRRRRALRLITVRIEQDRDLKHVDGRYDWREGAAFSPDDVVPPPARPGQAHASGSEHPEGTLSVTNATAAGVYCSTGCPQWESSANRPGSLAGTENSSPYATQLAVAGAASVCFEQGSRGSNPEGFANFGADGLPQPYQPGKVIASGENSDGQVFPMFDGTTVTEGIVAYDGLHAPSEEETAIAGGATTESLNYGLEGIKIGAGVPASALGFAIGFPSPGAIVSGLVGIVEFLVDRGCDSAPNLVDVSAAESGGAAFSAEIQAQTQLFAYYRSESGSAGVQLNPSTLSYGGSPLYLMPRTVEATGLGDNVCDCQKSTGNNSIYLEWSNYEPCESLFGSDLSCAVAAPPSSATATGAGVDCGPGNTACDFPASQSASTPSTTPGGGVGEVTACATNFREGTTLQAGQAATSPNGFYTLAMLTNGTASWFDGPANSMWASTGDQASPAYSYGPASIRAGSYAIMQSDGNFVVYTPQGTPIFATGTSGNPGAYLSLQNDGNLVIYNPSGQQALWASNTVRGPACGS
jgi:hypothetical protein